MERPFGGLTVVFGGDFRQIPPVVHKGTKADTVNVALNSSHLWAHVDVYHLKKNMRLHSNSANTAELSEILEFDKWLLEIGDGSAFYDKENELVKIPGDILLQSINGNTKTIIDTIYPALSDSYEDPVYLSERAILAPKNEMVNELNKAIMERIPGHSAQYLSADTVCRAQNNASEDDMLYTTKFLNSLEFSGVPNHILEIKVGTPVMLMRNLNQVVGLCNSTRMRITTLGNWPMEGQIMTGSHAGNKFTIPRIIMSPTESKWPFKLHRRQLPLSLCYAMTTNKSQGQSLNMVGIYLPNQVFTHGQLYVAASRVTNIKGLFVLNADEEMIDEHLAKNIVYQEAFTGLT